MKQVVFILGGPGSGKGTLCSNLVQQCKGLVHLSIGDLLRNIVHNKGEQWEVIKEHIDNGLMVPEGISEHVTINRIKETKADLFLIDGLPRTQENWNCWQKLTKDTEIHATHVIMLECSDDIMLSRVKKRTIEQGNMARDDDNDTAMKTRINIFRTVTVPLLESIGLPLVLINAQQAPEDVCHDVISIVSCCYSS